MANNRVASLRLELNGYAKADTSSAVEGRVARGTYPVLEELKDAAGNDFALLGIDKFDGADTWICTQSLGVLYADVMDAPTPEPRRDFSNDPAAIDEAKLVALFEAFDGFTYAADGQYPWPLPGVTIQTEKKQNNCCTFVEALVVKAWEGNPGFTWSRERHRLMMVDTSDRFGPITAAVEAGVALPAPSPLSAPQPWSIVQGWRSDGGGHTFIVVDHDHVSDRVLLLESNMVFKLNGPGYRSFGPLQVFGTAAPPQWSLSSECPTWKDVCARYVDRLHAGLRVKGLKLAGLPPT